MHQAPSVKPEKGKRSNPWPLWIFALLVALPMLVSPAQAGLLDEFASGKKTYLNVYWAIYSPREMGKSMQIHLLEVSQNYFLALGVCREILSWKRMTLEIEALTANHYGRPPEATMTLNYLEYAAFFNLRYQGFPWDRFVKTTVAIGEGYSYTDEKIGDENKYGLNYLQLEVTFAPPADDRLAFVFRIHHRSGVFGVMGRGDTNFYTFGLRYRF